MGQQPNIELEMADLPRPTAHPAPARRWSPARPGDTASPADVPTGTGFGATGPDAGYARRLIRDHDLSLAPGEARHKAEIAVGELAGARAARLGRAPTRADVDVAALLLGYDPEGVAPPLVEELAAARRRLVANIGHSARRRLDLVGSVATADLISSAAEIRERMGRGERLLGR